MNKNSVANNDESTTNRAPHYSALWCKSAQFLTCLAAVTALVQQPASAQNAFLERDLVSDIAGRAEKTDTNLVNPWGIAFSATSPFWISDNHTGLSTLYDSSGVPQSLVVTVPTPAGGTPPSSPTGIIFNGTTNFGASRFIFATEDGTISGWTNGANAQLKVDNSASGTIYKGLAVGVASGKSYLYAADFHNAKIDVFDTGYNSVISPGGFVDANLPAGFAPFNVQNIGGRLYVTYAKQDAAGEDDVPGPGIGYVDIFDTDGNFISRFASSGVLNSPWGLAVAPTGFGPFAGNLLIGNFGDGRINVFNAATGDYIDTLKDGAGNPISILGLWALAVGNGGNGGDAHTIYFTAGIPGSGALEDHGLFGSLSPIAPSLIADVNKGIATTLTWAGGTPPFLVQRKLSLSDPTWFNVMTTSNRSVTVANDADSEFFRIQSQTTNMVWPFTVFLSATNEPSPNTSLGTGIGSLSLEGTNLSWHIIFSGLTGPATAGHIHAPAPATNNTGVALPFTVPANSSGVVSGSTTISADLANNIINGQAYVNIHTAANGGGEIRGQIVPLRVTVNMSPAEEVGTVVSTGSGRATLTFIGNQIMYEIAYSGLSSSATAAHFHGPAAPGANNGVIIPLNNPSGTSGTISGTVSVSTTNLAYILAGQTYLNMHTLNNGGGEIRGQVYPYQFTANLNGASEFPVNNSIGTGTGTFSIAGGNLTYSVSYTNLSSAATAGHIHGPALPGANNGVIVPFTAPSGTSGTTAGTAAMPSPTAYYMLNGLTYANIHTLNFGGGEIRGQVMPKF